MFNRLSEFQRRASMLGPAHPTRRPVRPARSAEPAQAAVDAVLEDSFPASDPPSWTPSVYRPAPARPLAA